MTSVWWPGINHEIQNLVKQCPTCTRDFTPRKEPMIPTKLPDYPWQKIGTDLLHLKGVTYILVVDYFSRYPEIQRLTNTTSHNIIQALKTTFARHGVPETVVSDSGPQYASQEFSSFAKKYDFAHITSSPLFPRSNGQAECTVQTVKKLLKEATDPQMALLVYRTTPLPCCSLSPAELLMGRRLRANIPVQPANSLPTGNFYQISAERTTTLRSDRNETLIDITQFKIAHLSQTTLQFGVDDPVLGSAPEPVSIPRTDSDDPRKGDVECYMLVLTTLMHSVYFRLDSRTLITVIVTCVSHTYVVRRLPYVALSLFGLVYII